MHSRQRWIDKPRLAGHNYGCRFGAQIMEALMKGFKTIAFNGFVIVIAALLHYVAGIDWTQYVSPTVGTIILAGVNFALRFVTDTPVMQSQ